MKIGILALTALVAGSLVGIANAQTGYGITAAGGIVSFNPAAPGTFLSNVAITGLAAGETAYSIDARTTDGSLVILTSGSRMYTVNAVTGAATALGSSSAFTPGLNTVGGQYSIDFNPTVDRVRVVGGPNGGENFRLNPNDGSRVAGDTNLAFVTGAPVFAVGAAYRNFTFGVTAPMGSIREYVIYTGTAGLILGEVGSMAGGNASFNGGIVTNIGNLGIAGVSNDVGFDIYGNGDIAYVSVLGPVGAALVNNLYTVNLATGAATLVGAFDPTGRVQDITIVPTPSAAVAMGLGALVATRRRR
ncbi:hypothetical protein BH11PLA1_BH11PLA1_06500 [soil metagenome]